MKKIRTLVVSLMAFCMLFALAGCSESKPTASNQFANAAEVLDAIWQADDDAEKPSIVGGHGDDMVEGKAALVDLTETENVASSLVVPEDIVKDSISGACISNAMMVNAFTASAWELKPDTDMKAAVKSIEDQIKNQHWVCTFPEKYAIIESGNYLVVVFGYADQADPFIKAATTVLDGATIAAQDVIE